jgi:hypothetical protein
VGSNSSFSSGELPPPAAEKAKLPKLDASLAVWLILFVFGGGLLALYYAGIGYFPEVTWQDALTYMALMTIIGGSLLVAYSFLLFVPGVIWSEFLIHDKQLYEVLMMGAREWEPCVVSVTKRILFPFAVFMAFCHFLLYLVDENGKPRGLVAFGAAASLIAVSGLLGRDFLQGLKAAAEKKAVVGKPQPADVLADTPGLKWHRVLVGVSHAFLLGAFIVKASGCTEPDRGILWLAALLPLASLASPLIDPWIERLHSKPSKSAPAQPNSPPDGPPKAAVPDRPAGAEWCPPTIGRTTTTSLADVAASVCSAIPRIPTSRPAPPQPDDKWSLICRAVLAFGSAALLSLTALWFFYRIYRGPSWGGSNESDLLSLLVLCTLVVIVANLVVSVLYHKAPQAALLSSFLAALLLLGAGQLLPPASMSLPAKIMARFGFGAQSATLVLTEKGARILCEQGISVRSEKRRPPEDGTDGSGQANDFCAQKVKSGAQGKATQDTKKDDEDKPLGRAADVTILSRLGSEYLLRFENRIITLPKGEVTSWSVAPPTDY